MQTFRLIAKFYKILGRYILGNNNNKRILIHYIKHFFLSFFPKLFNVFIFPLSVRDESFYDELDISFLARCPSRGESRALETTFWYWFYDELDISFLARCPSRG